MGRHKFICWCRKQHVAYLRARVTGKLAVHLNCIPEFDRLISWASPCCKQWAFMRGPRQSFDCSCMLAKFANMFAHSGFPNHHHIVVSSWGQHSIVPGPLQPADLLAMACKPDATFFLPDVPDEYFAIFGAWGYFIACEWNVKDSYSSEVIFASGTLFSLLNIDDPDSARFFSNC